MDINLLPVCQNELDVLQDVNRTSLQMNNEKSNATMCDSSSRNKDVENYLRQMEKLKEEYIMERDRTASLLLQACVNLKLMNTLSHRKSKKIHGKRYISES